MDGEIALVPYYPNYAAALPWYQDPALCRQVDNRDGVYDLELLKRMYSYLNRRGDLYYIKYRNRLCGDVCLHPDGEINIVVAAPFQNRHILEPAHRPARDRRTRPHGEGEGHSPAVRGDLFLQRPVPEDVRVRGLSAGGGGAL